jgi:hypothetical protein
MYQVSAGESHQTVANSDGRVGVTASGLSGFPSRMPLPRDDDDCFGRPGSGSSTITIHPNYCWVCWRFYGGRAGVTGDPARHGGRAGVTGGLRHWGLPGRLTPLAGSALGGWQGWHRHPPSQLSLLSGPRPAAKVSGGVRVTDAAAYRASARTSESVTALSPVHLSSGRRRRRRRLRPGPPVLIGPDLTPS